MCITAPNASFYQVTYKQGRLYAYEKSSVTLSLRSDWVSCIGCIVAQNNSSCITTMGDLLENIFSNLYIVDSSIIDLCIYSPKIIEEYSNI